MMSRLTIASCLTAATLLFSGLVSAGGDADAGEKLAAEKQCAACHGPGGNSTLAMNPKIAGQYESYLVRALLDYKAGASKRGNAIMAGQVATLTEKDMRDLAAYFSSQESSLSVLKR